jgi:hypothetical protein
MVCLIKINKDQLAALPSIAEKIIIVNSDLTPHKTVVIREYRSHSMKRPKKFSKNIINKKFQKIRIVPSWEQGRRQKSCHAH